MGNQIKISVIVPVYNVEKYIRKSIESLIGQTYKNLEIILVDDGSTDRSGEICDEYAQKDNRIIVIHKENGGIVSARKTGIQAATGEYATNVDPDDWIEVDAYEKFIDIIEQYHPDVIISSFVKETGEIKTIRRDFLKEGFYNHEELLREIEKGIIQQFYCSMFNVSLCTKIVKREILSKYQNAVPNEIIMGEDTAVTLPMICDAKTVYVSEKAFYHYIQNKNSMSWEQKKGAYNRWLLLAKYLKMQMGCENAVVSQFCLQVIFYEMMVVLHDFPTEYFSTGIPFLKDVRKSSRVIVYGKGAYASNLIAVMHRYDLCNVVLNVDSSDTERLINLDGAEYDYVLIGILDCAVVDKVRAYLQGVGISDDKIMTISGKDICLENLPKENELFKHNKY